VRFRIRESKGARSQVDVPLGYFAKHRQKFRGYEKGKGPLKQEFIEERKFRIDMPGEHVGITKKGWVAPRLPRGSRFGAGIRFKKFKIF
jgi:hypothetical protein